MSVEEKNERISTESSISHTAVADHVAVKSIVSTKTNADLTTDQPQKIVIVMEKLSDIHKQIDESSRLQTQKISEEVIGIIGKIITDTKNQQKKLLSDGNTRSAAIEEEYTSKLRKFIEELDDEKAKSLSALEKDLHSKQEIILEEARKRINDINEEANRLKMTVLQNAKTQINTQVENISGEVAVLGTLNANRLLTSVSTTVIRTEATSANENIQNKSISQLVIQNNSAENEQKSE